jgi:hypothetical protein
MGSEIKVLGYEIKGWVLGFQIRVLSLKIMWIAQS